MREDYRTFADALIHHTLTEKKHHYIKILSALILFALDIIFVIFLLTPIPIVWESSLLDMDIQPTLPIETSQIQTSSSIDANTTTAIDLSQQQSGDHIVGNTIEYDVTIIVELLVLAPFMVASYLLYLGISGVRFYRTWYKKYQRHLQMKKEAEDSLRDFL